jgi:hypothetical protein
VPHNWTPKRQLLLTCLAASALFMPRAQAQVEVEVRPDNSSTIRDAQGALDYVAHRGAGDTSPATADGTARLLIQFPPGNPSDYVIGSGEPVYLVVDAALPDDSDLVVYGVSTSVGGRVAAVSHTLEEAPFVLDNARLDELPVGEAVIQVVLRRPGQPDVTVEHPFRIWGPGETPPDPWDNLPEDESGGDPWTWSDPPGPAEGFTDFELAPGGRIIYCAANGDDRNDGLSPQRPIRTIRRGYDLLRDDAGDWLLFRRGDTFHGGFVYWDLSGHSEEHPLVVGAYGEGPRPVIKTTGRGFINCWHRHLTQHVAFVGLHLYASRRDPDSPDYVGVGTDESGFRWLLNSENILFEDLRVDWFAANFNLGSFNQDQEYAVRDTTIRRCVILNAWPGRVNGHVGHSQGVFLDRLNGVTLEGNFLDHNGHNPRASTGSPTVFNHNVYVFQCKNVIFRNNVSARSSNFGIKIASDSSTKNNGFLVENNFFIGNTNCITIGGNRVDGDYPTFSSINVVVRNNVFTRHGRSLWGAPQSFGIHMQTVDNGLVEENLWVDSTYRGTSFAVFVNMSNPQRNVRIRNNTSYGWYTGTFQGSGRGVQSSNNNVDLPASVYHDASRTIDSYVRSIGGSSVEGLLGEMANQSRQNWRDELTAPAINDYFREGFSRRGGA